MNAFNYWNNRASAAASAFAFASAHAAKRFVPALMALSVLAAAMGVALADDTKEEAVEKERRRIEGTWRVVELAVNGEAAREEDARKIRLINGNDGSWTLMVDNNEISWGISAFDPTQEPKAIDFTVTEGSGRDNRHLGIYELGETTRKLCFAAPGKERPTEFASKPGSEHILLVLERE